MLMKKRFPQLLLSAIVVLAIMLSTFRLPPVYAQGTSGVVRTFNAQTGKLSFITPQSGPVLPAAQALGGTSLSQRRADPAMALVRRFSAEFGLKNPEQDLIERQAHLLENGRLTVRYQQTYQGIPVMGAELIVNTNENGDLYSINGEVSPDLSLPVEPVIDPAQAQDSAVQTMAKLYQKTPSDFRVSSPELWIFDPSLIMAESRPAELVWRMEVTSVDERVPVRELVLGNARSGKISLHFNQIDTAWPMHSFSKVAKPLATSQLIEKGSSLAALSLDVATYTAGNGTVLPGQFLCDETKPSCTNGVDLPADKAHAYAIGTFNLYAAQYGRNSIDNQGMQIISSVHYDVDYGNAFWSGTQMVYGDGYGFALADDVVAHELTHGVTQHESNLFYFYQSGAINESFSDLWGEFYDQTNSQGNDADAVKWQIGEDISGLGAIRDMRDPTLFDQPDKMSSSLYAQDEFDNGGVHTNSGVNSKAAYLMVSGGNFNSKTISALGWVKTAAIYYEVNTNLLSSGADYSDLYFALQRACSNLIGQKGITSADCTEVKDAIDSVEMNSQPVPNFNTDVPYCDQGTPKAIVFTDGLESGTGNWTFNNGNQIRWQLDSIDGPYAHSGHHSLYADDLPEELTDASARLVSLTIPGNAYLHFSHAFQFESLLGYLDGGVLEYSLNGGGTWQDAGSLINFNGYRDIISSDFENPLGGRPAFVGSSHGYIGTRLNLASLVGKTVAFRWRMGLSALGLGDLFEWPSGWWVDDVKLYTCSSVPSAFKKISPPNNSTGVPLSTTLAWESNPSASYYQYCYDIINDNQCNRTWIVPITATSAQISNLGANIKYYWQVRAVNAVGITEADNQSWGTFTTTSSLPAGTANIEAFVGVIQRGKYSLGSGQSLRESYTGVNNGPVKLTSTNSIPFIGAERVIYKVNGVNASFSEMMALPSSQLDKIYWLPWYNNVDLDTQLRFANISGTAATVHIYIGGQEMTGSPFALAAGASTRKSFPGVNKGPVKIESNVNIVAAERVIYKISGINTSFSEMMALPNKQLNKLYWLPWYNNVEFDTQLRFANVSSTPATVHVFIGGTEMPGSPFSLAAGASTRKSFPGVNKGLVKIESNVNIVAAERVIYKVNGVNTSFSEMMALPTGQVSVIYWLPWYNNVDLDTQLQFANVGSQQATVHVFIRGVEVAGSPFTLAPGGSTRKSFPSVNSGPVKIASNVAIVASERVIYKVNGINTSFSEMMGLANQFLDTTYWLPWYNNVELDTQLRFGVP